MSENTHNQTTEESKSKDFGIHTLEPDWKERNWADDDDEEEEEEDDYDIENTQEVKQYAPKS